MKNEGVAGFVIGLLEGAIPIKVSNESLASFGADSLVLNENLLLKSNSDLKSKSSLIIDSDQWLARIMIDSKLNIVLSSLTVTHY